MKKCSRCKEKKSESEFHLDSKTKDGLHAYCKNCSNEKVREHELHRLYRITTKQYESILKLQNGVCVICKQSEIRKQYNRKQRLSVDHNHKTGKIRGLLCHRCNSAIGYFKDNPELLRKAAEYLEKHQ